jgi:hypothetical protein
MYRVEIVLIKNTHSAIITHEAAEKVELLNAGVGVLSVIEDKKNHCYPLTSVMNYTVRDL